MDDVIDSNILVKKPAMRIIIMVLPVEEITAATLWVEVPKQNTKTVFGQQTSQVNGGCGFAYTTFDIIDCNFFQAFKLLTKL